MSARYTVTQCASVSAIIGAGTAEATSSTRMRPKTMKGWRPISVTVQPATVASQPENVMPARPHNSGRGNSAAVQPRCRYSHSPTQLNASINMPVPSINRKP